MPVHLNMRLIDAKNVSAQGVDNILQLHSIMEKLFEKCEGAGADWLSYNRIVINGTVEELEYAMQKAWMFEINSAYHSWWYRNPGCTCPKMDNADSSGSNLRHQNINCPLHGKIR